MSKCSSLLGPPPHKYSRFVKTTSEVSSVFRESTLQSKHVKFEHVWKNKILSCLMMHITRILIIYILCFFWALGWVGNFSFTAAGVSIAIIEEPQSPKVGKTQQKVTFILENLCRMWEPPLEKAQKGHRGGIFKHHDFLSMHWEIGKHQ